MRATSNGDVKGGEVDNFGAKAKRKIREVFGADLRSLAALRIVLALIVLIDLVMRAQDFRAFYTDDGVMPRSFLLETLLNDSMLSLGLIGGGGYFQGALFVATAIAAVCMLVGYRTRLSTVVVWILLLSIARRNPLVLNGGDTLIRMLLFWAMFLPLGAYWSVDRALKSRAERASRLDMRFVSVATAALFLQIAFVYFFTAVLKSGDEWRVDGTAIFYALNYEPLVRPFGEFLLNFPTLLTVMTFATLGLEFVGPLLLFSPIFNGLSRLCVAFAFAGLHLGIWMTMEIGLFPFVSALCMVCFLPGWFWTGAASAIERLSPSLAGTAKSLFSDLGERARSLRDAIVTLREVPGQNSNPNVLGFAAGARSRSKKSRKKNGKTNGAEDETEDEDAEVRRTENSNGKQDAKPEKALEDAPLVRLRASRVINTLAGIFLVYITLWNLTTISDFELSGDAKSLGFLLGITQKWSMFAPHPPTGNAGWFVLPGELENGADFDMMSVVHGDLTDPAQISYEKPDSVAGAYENKHWRKYLTSLLDEDKGEERRLYFGRYVCRTWNATHTGDGQLASFNMIYIQETPEGRRKANFLWRDFDCS